MTRSLSLALTALLGAAAALLPSEPAPAPDHAWLNGQVWTGDPARPWAEALAVRGDRIVAVGTTALVRTTLGAKAEVVDLRGRFVAPGFNDAHLHFLVQERAELDGATSEAEISARLRAWANAHPESPWILGGGWGYGAFGPRGPHRQLLDAVVPDRPVFLTDRDTHSVLVNSKALALAGITRATGDPVGGVVVKDAAGEPTGCSRSRRAGGCARSCRSRPRRNAIRRSCACSSAPRPTGSPRCRTRASTKPTGRPTSA
jgi:predicted amidohydrolase YtcJ